MSPPTCPSAEILVISKPLEPPWNDGSKVLARELVCAMKRHVPVALGTCGGRFVPSRGRVERIYGPNCRGHALGALDAWRVFGRLALGPPCDLWHFVFQPNPRASLAARSLARARRRPTVHTVVSAPRPHLDPTRVLFADRTVVLSRATERRFRETGIPGIVRIPPASRPLPVPDEPGRRHARIAWGLPIDAPLLVYPGDLERGEGARLAIEATAALPELHLALAYRAKTPATHRAERRLRALAAQLGVAARVHWIGETDRIVALLGTADVVALPSRDLGAKVDLPIVLLEAMWLARPVIVARGSASEELAEEGGAWAIPCDREALVDALRALLDDSATRAEAGRRARATAEAQYDPVRMAARYEVLYDELLR